MNGKFAHSNDANCGKKNFEAAASGLERANGYESSRHHIHSVGWFSINPHLQLWLQ